MKRDDTVSIILSVAINLLIVFLIPAMSVPKVENKKIKVGLVAYENKNRTKLDGQKNTNKADKKNLQDIKKDNKEASKPNPPKEKPVDKKKQELEALNKIANKLTVPQVELLTNVNTSTSKKIDKKLDEPKKEFLDKGGVVSQNERDIKRDISDKEKNLDLKIEEKLSFNSEQGKDSDFDRILKLSGDVEGLPSGYKLGTEDGDIVARWDNANREPIYPESAQRRGLHGSVRLRMNIDERGNVRSLHIDKGSGVPEINSAIEEIGRTWKIYLSKNGLSVTGDVILEYNFVLKGQN